LNELNKIYHKNRKTACNIANEQFNVKREFQFLHTFAIITAC
jgi:hypothetical protein